MTAPVKSNDPRAPLVSAAFDDRHLLKDATYRQAILETVADLDQGLLRVATPGERGTWTVHGWVQQAVTLYFAIAPMQSGLAGVLPWHDKVPLKGDLEVAGIRVVPGAVVRYGSFLERGAVVMPGFVNIGAWVGAGTMVDTWATVGSCAQIGHHVHLSGGVGIGGVLEPPGARPVIVEDECFIGSRAILVEGVHVRKGAVIAANTVLTASTHIIDVRSEEPVTLRGEVPERAVVVPGTRPRAFPGGTFDLPCALIIGERSASTDRKTSLNATLREFALG